MTRKLEEIEGVFHGERFRFGDTGIATVELVNGSVNDSTDPMITVKGDFDFNELRIRQRYRFYGRYANYRNKRTDIVERQFHFQTFVVAQSHDRKGVIEYIASAGAGNGVSYGTANRAWEVWGSSAVAVIRENPTKLMTINRHVTRTQCGVIGEKLKQMKATEDATIELTNLLAGRGFPRTTPRKAIKRWGNQAAQVISKDPYALMAFRGCGFKLCDSLWLELGHRPDRLKRQALCAWYAVASNTDGHTWFPIEHVAQSIRQNIGSAKARPKAAIKLALRLGRLSPNHYGALARIRTDGVNGPITENGSKIWIAEGRKAEAERALAGMVVQSVNEAKPQRVTRFESLQDEHGHHVQEVPVKLTKLPVVSLWPDPNSISGIDDHQREKLAEALVSRVAILGGSPGTGKTYATAMMIKSLLQSGKVGPQDIAIGAPTGKAAVRITEAMQAAGVQLQARTWHSLLGVGQSDEDDGGWSFLHNESNPWAFRIIVGDESSMLDTALMRSVLAACPRGAHILLVGDVNQLPPVGNGAPLRDMIASQVVGYGELTEIKRNSGGIVEACAAIRDGNQWSEGDNLIVTDSSDQIDSALGVISTSSDFDPVWDCQVLVAVNARSELSRKQVNKRLQAQLNSNPEIKGSPFRLKDKIVCLKNGKYVEQGSSDEVYVANGELAEVLEVEPKSIIAELQNPHRVVRIPRGKSTESDDDDKANTGCSWDLAYGLSTHKSQGSEWPIVIVLIDEYPGARMVCSREWLYTAISRAKAKCFLIGRKATADAMCRRVAIGKRKTLLREMLQLSMAEREIESL